MNSSRPDTSYSGIFGIGPSEARRLLSAALSKGGDYADIFCEHTVNNELSLRDGEVNSARSNIDFGVGIRVLSGDRTGYAFSESTRMEDLMRAASTAAEIARDSSSKVNLPEDCTPVDSANHYPLLSDSSDWERHTVEEKKEYLLMLRDLIQQASERVINITGRIGDQQTRILFFNSLGQCFTDMRPMALMSATVVMQEGSRMENFYASKSYRKGFDFLSQELVQALADDVVKGCNRLFEASRPPCGEMPVVMGAGGSGILLHEAIGHSFEADFNRKGTSIFSDRMGKLICNPDINIVDDGTLPYFRGSVNVDDEGVPGQKTYMVRNGVLNSYLHDRISARHYGVAHRQRPPRILPLHAHPEDALHLHGERPGHRGGPDPLGEKGHLRGQFRQRSGPDRRRRLHILRQVRIHDRGRTPDPSHQGHQHHRQRRGAGY